MSLMSGDFLHRPQLEEIYEAIKRGEIDLLLMYNVSRFARNSENATYHYVRAVKVHQIGIEFIDAPPSGKLEKFHFALQSVFAEEYRDQVMKQTQEKRRERVTKRGLLMPGAWPLFGYTWDNEARKGRYLLLMKRQRPLCVVSLRWRPAACHAQRSVDSLMRKGFPLPRPINTHVAVCQKADACQPIWWQAYISRMLHTPVYWGEHVAFRYAHREVVDPDPATAKSVYFLP